MSAPHSMCQCWQANGGSAGAPATCDPHGRQHAGEEPVRPRPQPIARRVSRSTGPARGGVQATRQAILEAAQALFYGVGIRAATMEDIAARAGVTKRTLYYYFRSKDDLIAACLDKLGEVERDRFASVLSPSAGSLEARVRSLFATLARDVRDPRWKGCCFARAAGELAGLPGHPGILAARKHRQAFEAWLRRVLAAEGLAEPAVLSRRFLLLLDGAIVQGFLHHDPEYVLEAGEMATLLFRHRFSSESAPVVPAP
ncbi:MAG: TetR/AcrR family transcriptional regulator [Proteobacteria bacterium]|nr:TetR/AcrR family transcriptional regulator [Pseudomonadota bacterium]